LRNVNLYQKRKGGIHLTTEAQGGEKKRGGEVNTNSQESVGRFPTKEEGGNKKKGGGKDPACLSLPGGEEKRRRVKYHIKEGKRGPLTRLQRGRDGEKREFFLNLLKKKTEGVHRFGSAQTHRMEIEKDV